MYIYIYTFMYICMYNYMYVYIYACIYIYICACYKAYLYMINIDTLRFVYTSVGFNQPLQAQREHATRTFDQLSHFDPQRHPLRSSWHPSASGRAPALCVPNLQPALSTRVATLASCVASILCSAGIFYV